MPALSRTLRLALLAPDIIDAILAGRKAQSIMLDQLERPLPTSWEQQRAAVLAPERPTINR